MNLQTAERQASGGAKWPGSNGVGPRPGHPDIRPRVSSSETGPMTSRPEQWGKFRHVVSVSQKPIHPELIFTRINLYCNVSICVGGIFRLFLVTFCAVLFFFCFKEFKNCFKKRFKGCLNNLSKRKNNRS